MRVNYTELIKGAKMRTLTTKEVIALLALGLDACPYRVLTEHGEQVIRDWIGRVAQTPQKFDAWFAHAEMAAGNSAPDEAVIIELGQFSTYSRLPETLTLRENCFEWRINE
jgi:hypothetical protein